MIVTMVGIRPPGSSDFIMKFDTDCALKSGQFCRVHAANNSITSDGAIGGRMTSDSSLDESGSRLPFQKSSGVWASGFTHKSPADGRAY